VFNLKHDQSHIDVPTFPSSPAKKRAQADEVEETVPTHDVVSGPKSKITAFWKIATHAEKEETNQHEFQKLRDNFEETTADIAEEKRRKLARVRTQARERQQTHRNRSKEKKMEAGWVPGTKWVT
jgi:hypothetical protein